MGGGGGRLKNGGLLFSSLPVLLNRKIVVFEGFQPVPTCVPPKHFLSVKRQSMYWRECLIYTCLGNQPATHRSVGSLAVNQQGNFCALFSVHDPLSLFHNGAPLSLCPVMKSLWIENLNPYLHSNSRARAMPDVSRCSINNTLVGRWIKHLMEMMKMCTQLKNLKYLSNY